MAEKKKKKTPEAPPGYLLAVPAELEVPADPLRLRLDFHSESVVMQQWDGAVSSVRMVSAMDVAHALASELSYGSGLLPEGALWWANTSAGPLTAVYEAPSVRKFALQEEAGKPPRRFEIPMPGLILLCLPGRPPWVYAVKRRPGKPLDPVYKAPMPNVYDHGASCPGNNRYPQSVNGIIESFFRSFFSFSLVAGHSQKYKNDVVKLWESLEGKRKFPNDDLVKHGTVKDLMEMRVS